MWIAEHCIISSYFCAGGTFLIYNVDNNKCMSSSLERLFNCDHFSNSQQFRWISKNRILNTFTKKCLGVGSKAVGKTLQWLKCEDDSVLQKWECSSGTLLGLKNESLYLAVNSNGVPVISADTGAKTKWTIQGTENNICSQPYEGMCLNVSIELFVIKWQCCFYLSMRMCVNQSGSKIHAGEIEH